MANSKRKCGGCGEYFRPEQEFPGPVAWCSPDCGLIVAKKRVPAIKERKAKEARAEHRAAKERVKTRSQWLKEAQTAFNAYIRARDEGLPCISCGQYVSDADLLTGSRMDAGHYRSTGSSPELRFEESNCHAQCVKCNRYLSGVAADYRIGLIQRIGVERVEWLEGPQEPKHYTIDDLRGVRDLYRAKLKALKKERAAA